MNPNSELFKVVFLGDSGYLYQSLILGRVGKTSFIMCSESRPSSEYEPTIGSDFHVKHYKVDNSHVRLQIWDTAGQERFHSIESSYYHRVDCCVLMFDVTKNQTLDSLYNWKEKFAIMANIENLEHFPFFVVANKIDLDESGDGKHTMAVNDLCSSGNFSYFESSAKKRWNVENIFQSIATTMTQTRGERCDQVLLSSAPVKHGRRSCC
ncbi:probable Ras-related protein Rab7 [Octopus sinensis]|uniref:Probable Ras-related protein Rab7 n=1 Tax=Octopus sinensis TaxID=2607531 RepID=A0A6P7U338_9MOLL|nr:probable Ras-related protein Rab7 [Octopus sinensis]